MNRLAGIAVASILTVLGVCAMAAQGPAPSAGAGGALGGYDSLRMDQVGVFVGGFDGSIERMYDGVRITLISNDPARESVPISCREMNFTWSKEKKQPARIEMAGKVVIIHPQGTVRAEKADWDFSKNELTFTGDPVISTPQLQDCQCQKVVFDFASEKFMLYGATAKMLQLGGEALGAGEADPSLLREQDITDWPAFLTSMKTQAAEAAPSPGKRIVSLLDAKVRSVVTTTPAEKLLQDKAAILKQVNRVLSNARLYDAAAWTGVTLDADTQGLLEKKNLSATEQTRLNRGLLEAAYPGVIAARPKAAG